MSPTTNIEESPYVLEKTMATACASACKCVVTSTCTADKQVRVLIIHQCRRDHAEVIERLSAAAKSHAITLAERLWR